MNRNVLIDAAMGRTPCDRVLKNLNIVDVLGHGIIKGNIYIKDGYITAVGDFALDAKEEIDMHFAYAAPAFIDAHVHIESSMLTPSKYAELVIPHGTTAVIADPHEIANVCGENGLAFMKNDKSPLKVFYMLPSCVPATAFDSSGAVLDLAECERLWNKGGFLGLGEMMNYPGVVFCDPDVMGKLSLTDKIDGHIPMTSGNSLQAYICGGIKNDHECSTAKEALEKISAGLNIYIREGTGAKNLEELIKAVTPYNMSHFAFCTDDKHIDDVSNEGTISHCISKAIALGMEPVTAFTLGSYNAANFYGLKNLGAIAPSYEANLVIMEELNPNTIKEVYVKGEKYRGGNNQTPDLTGVSNTVNIKSVTPADLTPVFSKNTPIISAQGGTLITEACYTENAEGLLKCAVIERHHASGRIGTCFVKGFHIENGAVAQTIGHDSHNITVMGDNSEDMALAVNSLGREGGIVVVKGGKVIARLTLEVGGLMSARPYKEVMEEYAHLSEAVGEISTDKHGELLMILSFLSLPVIPHLKLTDKGLFDVDKFKLI